MITESDDLPPSYNSLPPETFHLPTYTPDHVTGKGIPPELQSLLQVNQLVLQEKFSVAQGMGRNFHVLNQMNQKMYEATQSVQCCGPYYQLEVQDNEGRAVLEVLENCGCRCTRQTEVTMPSLGAVGSVTLHLNAFVTHLSIMNPSNEVILLIVGPSFHTNIFGNVTFEVKSRDEQHVVGIIQSEGSRYIMTFPMDLEVTMKAMLLACCFYLESLIYDKRRYVVNRPSSD